MALILALTGYPVGLAWDEYLDLGLIQKPTAYCYVVENLFEKIRLLKGFVQEREGRIRVRLLYLDVQYVFSSEPFSLPMSPPSIARHSN